MEYTQYMDIMDKHINVNTLRGMQLDPNDLITRRTQMNQYRDAKPVVVFRSKPILLSSTFITCAFTVFTDSASKMHCEFIHTNTGPIRQPLGPEPDKRTFEQHQLTKGYA